MTALPRDLCYAIHALARQPGYALVTIVVFALALGANTTVFSVFNGLFLRPLQYPEGDRLVAVFNVYPKMNLPFADTSIPDYLDRRDRAPSLEDLAIYTASPRTLGGQGSPLRILVTRASPSLFNVLGSAPLLGRLFTAAESTPGADRVAIVSERLWRDRFGGQRDALGADLELDGERYQVIGVMPEAFGFPDRTMDVWVPFAFTPEQMSDAERGTEFSGSVGRLRPGATIAGLQTELDTIVQQNVASGRMPQGAEYLERSGFAGRAEPLRERLVGNYRQTLLVLQGLVLAVLAIACANVANLQLTRLLARRRELAIRAALGADRSRLARLVLAESLLLALLGGAAGCLVARGGLALVRLLGVDLSSQGITFAQDGRVFAVTAIAAVLAAIASSLLPLVMLLRTDLGRTVQEAGRLGDGGPRARVWRGVLVGAQIAVSVALLAGAGLLLQGFQQLQRDGTGFRAEQVWTARIALPENRYADLEARTRFFDRALAELRALPGVTHAGLTSALPFSGNNSLGSFSVAGYTPPPGIAPPHAQKRSIDAGFLPALDVPVIRGRNFSADEPEPVALVDENLAAKFWPDTDPIGQRIGDAPAPEESRWFTVIGVVPPLKHAALTEEPNKDTIYWHYRQKPAFGSGAFTLRTTLAPEQLTRAATAAITAIDPNLVLFDVVPLAERVTRSLGPLRTPMVLVQVFAAIAFALAVVGVYGVLNFNVAQRSGEFGVRLALGARGGDVVRLVFRQGTRLLLAGLVAGTIGALALGRLLASQLPAVAASDVAVFTIAIAGVTLATLIACWLPTRRAARIDPLRALRME